jgi:predicted RecA/RadA family phage recombinase
MKTLIYDGDEVQVTAAGALTAGTGTLIGVLFGIPQHNAVLNDLVTLQVEGVVTIAKTDETAVDVGDALYWDDSAKEVNKTNTGKPVGIAVSSCAVTAGIVTIDMLLVPTVRNDIAA